MNFQISNSVTFGRKVPLTGPPPGVVLDIGEGQLSQTFGERRRLRLTFFGEGGDQLLEGGGFKSDGVDNPTLQHLLRSLLVTNNIARTQGRVPICAGSAF